MNKKIPFIVIAAVVLAITVFFSLNSKQESKTSPNQSTTPQSNTITKENEPQKETAPEAAQKQQPTEMAKETPKAEPASKTNSTAIKILKSEVTASARFYPYKLDGISMEVIAVKASDGTIRTALNTCQVCFDSGRGYYKQVGEFLVCQNCGNRFHIDQVEKIKGGCNPVPILEENKQYTGDSITISKDFMASQKEYFSNWKKE